ncbi:MAG: prenyltransferase/squalene oxidase repeat-containing protein [Crocosphaera sp.]|nr:prenyltransferase/squalene oxidase repeat-containing protein [Crocosphaera sp.]
MNTNITNVRPTISQYIQNSSRWLQQIQHQQGKENGGFGEYQGKDPNCLNTSEVILALKQSFDYLPFTQIERDKIIKDGVDFIIAQQASISKETCQGELDCGSWTKIVHRNNHEIRFPDTLRTAYALLALNLIVEAGSDEESTSIQAGLTWLKNAQRYNGGWGYKAQDGQGSELFPTCLCLQALVNIFYDRRDTVRTNLIESIDRGFGYLETLRNFREDGSFGNSYGSLLVSHTLYAIETMTLRLQKDKNSLLTHNRSRDINYIKKGIDWVNQQRNEILSWTSELVKLEPENLNASGNYMFSHNNPALYLRIINPNPYVEDRTTVKVRTKDTLMYIGLNLCTDINNYGFPGTRAISWATAKTIRGLVAVLVHQPEIRTFPSLPPSSLPSDVEQFAQQRLQQKLNNIEKEFKQDKNNIKTEQSRKTIGFVTFVLVLCIMIVVLAFYEKVSLIVATLFTIIILAVLLVYGSISENSVERMFEIMVSKMVISRS